MKKQFLGAVVALTLAGLAGPATAGAQDFTVHNLTGFTIHALYVSESDKDSWGKDILGKDTLEDGDSVKINFHGYGDEVCTFDVRIEDESNNAWEVENLDLCKISHFALKKSGKQLAWEAE